MQHSYSRTALTKKMYHHHILPSCSSSTSSGDFASSVVGIAVATNVRPSTAAILKLNVLGMEWDRSDYDQSNRLSNVLTHFFMVGLHPLYTIAFKFHFISNQDHEHQFISTIHGSVTSSVVIWAHCACVNRTRKCIKGENIFDTRLPHSGKTTANKKAPIHYIISINDTVHRPL